MLFRLSTLEFFHALPLEYHAHIRWSADMAKGSYPSAHVRIRYLENIGGAEPKAQLKKKRGRERQLNGNIIEHFVAKGSVTSLKGSLMIDNDDGTSQ